MIDHVKCVCVDTYFWRNILNVLPEFCECLVSVVLSIRLTYVENAGDTLVICTDTLHRNVRYASNRSDMRSVYVQCGVYMVSHVQLFIFHLKVGPVSTY